MPEPSAIHPGYSIETLTPEIFAQLTPLMEDAFGTSVPASYFDWKYLRNPAGPAIGLIARSLSDGEIAAFYGMIPELYRFQGQVRQIHQSCDTMTHSRHRRKGLFQALAQETYRIARADDPGFVAFGFGGPTSTPGFLKMGWRVAIEIGYRFRPYPLTLLSAGFRAADPSGDPPDDRLIRLVVGSAKGKANGVDKNDDFVRWRLANPLRNYRFLAEREQSYAIFYSAGDFIFLFDFWEESPGAGRGLMGELERLSLNPRRKGLLTFCQDGSPLQRALRGHGFFRNPLRRGPASDRIPFITYGADEITCRNWSITPFDHDSY